MGVELTAVTERDGHGIDWAGVGRAVRAGAPLLLPVLGLQMTLLAASDDPSDAWAVALLALLLAAFVQGGRTAAAEVPTRALRHAALAGVGLFVVWLPLRLVVAVAGESDRPFAGSGAGLALAVLASVAAAMVVVRRNRT